MCLFKYANSYSVLVLLSRALNECSPGPILLINFPLTSHRSNQYNYWNPVKIYEVGQTLNGPLPSCKSNSSHAFLQSNDIWLFSLRTFLIIDNYIEHNKNWTKLDANSFKLIIWNDKVIYYYWCREYNLMPPGLF